MSQRDKQRWVVLAISSVLLVAGFFWRAPLTVAGVLVTDNILHFLAACGMLIGFGIIQAIKAWRHNKG